jgi:hypothetical protein
MSGIDAPKRLSTSAYQPLATFLRSCKDDEVRCSFADIERILGQPLPRSAFKQAWWASYPSRGWVRPWTAAGWAVTKADVRQRRVMFARKA